MSHGMIFFYITRNMKESLETTKELRLVFCRNYQWMVIKRFLIIFVPIWHLKLFLRSETTWPCMTIIFIVWMYWLSMMINNIFVMEKYKNKTLWFLATTNVRHMSHDMMPLYWLIFLPICTTKKYRNRAIKT